MSSKEAQGAIRSLFETNTRYYEGKKKLTNLVEGAMTFLVFLKGTI